MKERFSPMPFRRAVFTLIELLVVIAIIGILAGLILAVLAKAKDKGKGVACMNNMNQMLKANNTYSTDYGYYMPVYDSSTTGPGKAGKQWAGYSSVSTIDITGDGFMLPYLNGNWKAMVCPDWKIEFDPKAVEGGVGYGYNVYGVGTWAYLDGVTSCYSSGGSLCGMKNSRISQPSQTVAYADIVAMGPTVTAVKGYVFLYPYYTVPGTGNKQTTIFSSLCSRGDNVQFRHNGLASAGWLDGHVSSERPTRLQSASWAREAKVGAFGPMDNSLYDPWDIPSGQ